MKHLLLKFFKREKLGLRPLPRDDRDLGAWNLFGIYYKPKYIRNVIGNPFPAKKQEYNTCGWVSLTGAKQIDEGVELDERVAVMLGKKYGYISGDGFSNLRDNEKILQKYGVAEKSFTEGKLPSFKNWNQYSDYSLLTDDILKNAEKRKSESYLRIYNVSEVHQAIDKGRPVRCGIRWRTAFNMSGGFSFPWILNFLKGYFVGGHAVYIYGYDTNYDNKSVFLVRNSFGDTYGNKGDFYITEDDLQDEIDDYGAYYNIDMPIDLAKWLVQHQGKSVRTTDNPDVFLIQGDKKRKYDDQATFYAHGKNDSDVLYVEAEYLNKVNCGNNIKFWDGGNVKQIKVMLQKHDDIKNIFKKYFKELI